MPQPRVLILSTWFPPVNAPGARRPYRLARCLAERGWQVSVLTSTPEQPTSPYGQLDDLRILRTPRGVAMHDLGPFQRSLARLISTSRGSRIHRPLHLIGDLVLPFRHQLRWDLPPERIADVLGPQDIVVATTPDPAVLEAGHSLARYWNAVFAADYRDPWNVAVPEVAKDIITHQGHGIAGGLRRWRMRRLEKALCRNADVLTAVSAAFLENAQRVTGHHRGEVIHGGFDGTGTPPIRVPAARFILAHTGQLYPEQPWSTFFQALRILHTDHPPEAQLLRVRFHGATSTDPRTLEELQRTAALTGLIELLPTLDPEAAISAQYDSDELLQLALTGRKGYLPVKFLEYLGAGRPILLFSAEADEMEAALTSTRTGTIVQNVGELVQHLLARLRGHATGRRPAYAPDPSELQRFDYARNMGRWADLLETALHKRDQSRPER